MEHRYALYSTGYSFSIYYGVYFPINMKDSYPVAKFRPENIVIKVGDADILNIGKTYYTDSAQFDGSFNNEHDVIDAVFTHRHLGNANGK